eukprot:404476_1
MSTSSRAELVNKSVTHVEGTDDNHRFQRNSFRILGFSDEYIHRALKIHCKHYGNEYKPEVVIEIIFRLKVKDKLKKQKREQNIFGSSESVAQILLSMDFTPYDIQMAIKEYEKEHDNSAYNLEIITQIIMNIRARYRKNNHRNADVNGDHSAMAALSLTVHLNAKLVPINADQVHKIMQIIKPNPTAANTINPSQRMESNMEVQSEYVLDANDTFFHSMFEDNKTKQMKQRKSRCHINVTKNIMDRRHRNRT